MSLKTLPQSLQKEVQKELAKRELISFVTYNKPDYSVNWHHKLLADKLDAFVRGEIKRLMVFMPPQHGKSELVSRNLPAYILGRNPKSKIVLASYSADLASGFNRDCQRITQSKEYGEVFPMPDRKKGYQQNSEIFETGYGGFFKTVGVGGSLTGTPADIGIIDDPVKDAIEAKSPTTQQRIWEWYTNVFETRLHNDSRVLLTMTRWDENDLAGKLLEQMQEERGEKWEVLVLPAIKENDDNEIDPRQIGDPLWPKRHNKERLDNIRKTSEATWQSLYQQNPKPTETGGEFYKCFKAHRHVGITKYNPSKALHISWDDNLNPYLPAGIFQIEGKKIMMIDEFAGKNPNNRVSKVCAEILRKYQGHSSGCFIYGDATSNKEDTKLEKGYDFFRLIIEALEPLKPQRRVSKSNPSVVMRGMFINTVFELNFEGIEVIIGENCTYTIKDLTYIKEGAEGEKVKEEAVDPITRKKYQKLGHFSDLFDYIMCYAFSSEYLKYQKGSDIPIVQTGKNRRRTY